MISPRSIGTLFFAILLSGCGDSKETFDVSNIKPWEGEPYAFSLPSDKSYVVKMRGNGFGPDDGAELHDFDEGDTKGKWQIWISHNVWANNPGTAFDFVDRNRSTSAMLSALHETKVQNNLDFELNFIQIDKIPALAAAKEAAVTNNLSLSPPGDVGCSYFWHRCVDRFVISPFTRFPEAGHKSQREWLMPVLSQAIQHSETHGKESSYTERLVTEPGILDERSDYWEHIWLSAFIVNPDGKVVDVLNPSALRPGVNTQALIARFIEVSGLDAEDIQKPKANHKTGFKEDYLTISGSSVRFGGDYIQNAVDVFNELLK